MHPSYCCDSDVTWSSLHPLTGQTGSWCKNAMKLVLNDAPVITRLPRIAVPFFKMISHPGVCDEDPEQ